MNRNLALLLTLLTLLPSPSKAADNLAPCLTKEQAKAKYPGQWLYWHTEHRCWDNVSVKDHYTSRRGIYGKTNSLKLAPPHLDPNGNIARIGTLSADEIDNLQYREQAEDKLRTCCWPPLPPFIPWEERIQ